MLKNALELLKFINDKGYVGYIVGGYVRDYLLDINSLDIDITTNMPIEEFQKYYEINNIKHASFCIDNYEVTLFRKELSYTNQRHPEIKLVNSYKEDYIRRDFTINALAFDFNMDLIDFCNGKSDLSNKLIKTIREPNLTFLEDPVRILRAIYFKNKLSFNYDELTYNAILHNVKEINNLSSNRIITEFSKMILNLNIYINDLIKTNAYRYLFPNALLYIFNNKISINNIEDIFAIEYYLTNELNVEYSSLRKKYIKKYVDVSKEEFTKIFIYENKKFIEDANKFNKLINNKIQNITLDINEIYFDFTKLNEYNIAKVKIGNIKNIIIDKVLNKELNNNEEDIISFIKTMI